jgi:hypothetical protein
MEVIQWHYMCFASFANFYTKPDYDPFGPKRVGFGKQNIDSSELQLCVTVFLIYLQLRNTT